MGFTEILTIVFVFLKVFCVIDWSWFLVFLPEIIAGAIYLVIAIVTIAAAARATTSSRGSRGRSTSGERQ